MESNVRERLKDVPKVVVVGEGYKYLLLGIEDEEERWIIFFRGDTDSEYHSEILSLFRREISLLGPDLRVYSLGGGMISIDKNAQTILIRGESAQYGRPRHGQDIANMLEMLKEKFQGYRITNGY